MRQDWHIGRLDRHIGTVTMAICKIGQMAGLPMHPHQRGGVVSQPCWWGPGCWTPVWFLMDQFRKATRRTALCEGTGAMEAGTSPPRAGGVLFAVLVFGWIIFCTYICMILFTSKGSILYFPPHTWLKRVSYIWWTFFPELAPLHSTWIRKPSLFLFPHVSAFLGFVRAIDAQRNHSRIIASGFYVPILRHQSRCWDYLFTYLLLSPGPFAAALGEARKPPKTIYNLEKNHLKHYFFPLQNISKYFKIGYNSQWNTGTNTSTEKCGQVTHPQRVIT